MNGADECPCQAGFIEYERECLNEDCRIAEPNCQDCHILLENPGQVVCKQCMGDRVLDAERKCICKVGFHEVAGDCVACGNGCQVC